MSADLEQTPVLLLTVEQAAALLGIRRTKLYELLGRGLIHSVKIGACRRIPRSALDAFVATLSGEADRHEPAR